MKKISQIGKSVWFKAAFSLVSGSHQWCDPGSVRFFSIFFTLRLLQQWDLFWRACPENVQL
jgi:hypothetical protein